MRCVIKPVLCDSETYENINSKTFTRSFPEKMVSRCISNLYGVDVHDMKPEDIGMGWVCETLIESSIKTNKFQIISMGYDSEYLESITNSVAFPNLPIPIEFHFTFSSNKDMNLYKLKNPLIYNELFSERIHLLKKLDL